MTDEQRHVVEWGDGPLMVLAGAGTGKTTVIVERVRALLERSQGEPLLPEHILVLTYNVKAAAELRERFDRELGAERAARLTVANFHSFGHSVLRDHRDDAGLAINVDILDEIDQRLLLRDIRPNLDLRYHVVRGNPYSHLSHLASVISRAKDELIEPQQYVRHAQRKRDEMEGVWGTGSYEAALASLTETMAVARQVRREGDGAADREARRAAQGGGNVKPWKHLTAEEQDVARGLKPTYQRDGAALEVLRLSEEASVFEAYQAELLRRGVLDFGEQIARVIHLFVTRPNILASYQARYHHILVDEFQDANIAQVMLLELLGRAPNRTDNVVVVGDDDQSIYRFRGASYAAFGELDARFSRPPAFDPARRATPVERLPLTLNRRSQANVLAAATALIEHNDARLKAGDDARLQPLRSAADPVEEIICRDEEDEADTIVQRIGELYAALPERIELPDGSARPKRLSDVAVLYRMHKHRDLIVDRLTRAGIPFSVIGRFGVFAQPDIRDLEAALRVCAHPDDSVSFTRLLSAPPWRFDASEILRLTRAASFDKRPVFEAAAQILRAGEIEVDVVEAQPGEGRGAVRTSPPGEPTRRERLDAQLRAKLQLILAALDDLSPRANRDGPFAILNDYLDRTHLLYDLIAVGDANAQRRLLHTGRFMRFVSEWQQENPRGSLASFVAYLDLYQELGGDLELEAPVQKEVEGVQLMTIYQAKGLEYEVVVIPRLVERAFPYDRDEKPLIPLELLRQQPPAEFAIAEERRLCYVAMTRARRYVLMTGIGGAQQPSRFLAETAKAGATVVSHIDHEPPATDTDADAAAGDAAPDSASTELDLTRLMPIPAAFERRFGLRRRAVELIGALEDLPSNDAAARDAILEELVAVATDAAHASDEARTRGIDPLTLQVVSRHTPAGEQLLKLAPLPEQFSYSQFSTYASCPLRYALAQVYRIPAREEWGYFAFGSAMHGVFERFTVARRTAIAAGQPPPDFAFLEAVAAEEWDDRAYVDVTTATAFHGRVTPMLQRFYASELARMSEALLFEVPFTLAIEAGGGAPPIRLRGYIDRIDRHPNGSIEIIDYKTGRSKSQTDVDADEQLGVYALALRAGLVRDPVSGEPLPTPSKLTLYFTEEDLSRSTVRTDAQLDELRDRLVATARRIRSGDFAATPSAQICSRCDYRIICPSRYGATQA